MQYAWFVWSLILLGVWAMVYILLDTKDKKREMLVVSLWTSFLGLTEPLFVPEYWTPPSLFDLAMRTGFDIESVMFAFAIGGIASAIYERIFRVAHKKISLTTQQKFQHRYHAWTIVAIPILFIALEFATTLNPIYSAIIAMTFGGFLVLCCRQDLKEKMFVSAFLFLVIYTFYFFTLIALYSGYVAQVWNIDAISKIFVFGIPIEELLFALSFGFLWSGIYEYIAWHRLSRL